MDEALFFGVVEDRIYIKATGHVTAAFCPELKSRCFARLDDRPPVKSVIFDLSKCEYMDSTFLGLIVGLARRLKGSGNGTVTLAGTSAACIGLLKTIGVLKLVTLVETSEALPETLERVGRGAATTAQFLLDTHEELSSLSDENRAKFSALTSILRESIKNPGGGNS